MKRIAVFGLSFLLVLAAFWACKPKVGGVVDKSQDLLALLPQDVQGVLVIDVQRGMKIEPVADFMVKAQEEEDFKTFIEKTGIDPRTDIRFLAVGMKLGGEKQSGVGVVNLDYDREALLAAMSKEGDVTKSDYKGVTIYTPPSEDKGEDEAPAEEMRIAFLDEANILAGSPGLIEAAIDVFQGTKAGVNKNAELMPLIREVNKKTVMWGVFLIPPEALKETAGQVPMLGNMEAIQSVLMSLDYQDQNVLMEFKAKGTDEAKLKQIADALNGIKGLGGMIAGERPEIGELLTKIEISSGKDHVAISAVLPEELIKKLVAMAEQAAPKPEPELEEEPVEESLPDLQ